MAIFSDHVTENDFPTNRYPVLAEYKSPLGIKKLKKTGENEWIVVTDRAAVTGDNFAIKTQTFNNFQDAITAYNESYMGICEEFKNFRDRIKKHLEDNFKVEYFKVIDNGIQAEIKIKGRKPVIIGFAVRKQLQLTTYGWDNVLPNSPSLTIELFSSDLGHTQVGFYVPNYVLSAEIYRHLMCNK